MSSKSILLTWRDEAYGSVSSAAVAFRSMVEPYPSGNAQAKIARVYKRHGFAVNHSRASWINESGEFDAAALIADLEGLGYEVEHAGRVPESITSTGNAPNPSI